MEQKLQEAIALHRQGSLANAERVYIQILQQDPNHVDALHLLGMVALQTRRPERGIRLIEKVIRLNPNIASAHNNRGIMLRDLERFDEAVASYDRAIALEPDSAASHNNRGVALKALARLDEALASHDKAIALAPDYAEAHSNRGIALRDLKRFGEAVASCDRAIALRPDYAEAHNNRGIALRDLKRLEEALAGCDRAIALRPGYAEAHNNRGIALRELKRPEEALASYDRAIALKPDYAEAYSNRCIALQDLRRCDEAIASCDKAIALNPRNTGAYYNKSMACLATGDLPTGWKLYEYRKPVWDVSRYRPYRQPLWLGEGDPAGKTVFLTWEQGFGDTIQFCRYARLVQALGARVVLSVQEPLVRLLRQLEPRIQIVGPDQEPGTFDLHCPLMSLPLAFGTTLETIPSAQPYLVSDPRLQARWAARLPPGTRPRIGLAWSGYVHHPNDHSRSVALSQLRPLLSLDVDWVCLQKEFRPAEAASLASCPRLTLLGDELEDFADTASVIDQLDLVIAVDTSVAHLAGALGKSVWILLSFSPDWRWLLYGEESPWYPTARLYRQPRIDDWPAVIEEVKSELASRFLG